MERFEGRCAVITGAASGFGAAFARQAAALGMRLALADLQEAGLQSLAAELRAGGSEVHTLEVDVARAGRVEALAELVRQRLGVPHLLFNNAGVSAGGLVWEHTPEDWQWVLGVNLMGVVHGIRAFVPTMLAAEREDAGYEGHVVNTASMAGLLCLPNHGAYTVSKHAVVALSETLHQDLAVMSERVHASVLSPYSIPTGIAHSERLRPAEAGGRGQTPSQRIAQAMAEKAVAGGRLSADDMARMTFEAIRRRQFYVFSHPHALGTVRNRMEDIVGGRNPSDPFAERPELGRQLREALRAESA
jgi:NAD(P)-dependent dehydrogenase (short-subunit alcohol dehydrogenase family)